MERSKVELTSWTNLRLDSGMGGRTCTRLSDDTNLCFETCQVVLPLGAQSSTYSAKVFSTSSTNFPLCLAKATSSSEYTTLRFGLCVSGLMPSASARRALRFAISHSFVQCGVRAAARPAGLETLRPHSTDCRMRPHAQVTVMVALHGSTSGQAEGA